MKTVVNIYGENHTKIDEVNSIINRIVETKPDIIVHELPWDDKDIYLERLGRDIVIPLETSNLDYDEEIFDIPKRFSLREEDMLSNIKTAIEFNREGIIAVVVGDTHLRTTKTRELGRPSVLNSLKKERDLKVNIFRSQYIEIK